jgi:hypothetical protein
MTIAELKVIIRNLPDDMRVLKNGYDHMYNITHAKVKDIEISSRGWFYEYFDDDSMFSDSTKGRALIIREGRRRIECILRHLH